MDPTAGPIAAFAFALNQLRKTAGLTLDELAATTHYAKGTLSRATDGRKLPAEDLLKRYVVACGGDPEHWLQERARAAQKANTAEADAQEANTAGPTKPTPGRRRPFAAGERLVRRRPRLSAFAALALVSAVIVLLAAWPGAGGQQSASASARMLPSCAGPATDQVQIAASTDKSALLAKLAASYGTRSSHGQCVQVAVQSIDSGTAMSALARGWNESDGPSPDVWSPASTVWLPLAQARATTAAAQRLPAQPGPSIVTSPLTIAMPEPMAKALGWPNQKIGWSDLVHWAQDPNFWAHHGHPQWGSFRLGKTNPEYSTSGMNATIAAFFAATGTTDELVNENIDSPANQKFERAIEHAAVHYGDTTLTFLANLRHADDSATPANPDAALSYISAVTVEEQAVVAYNLGYPCGTQSSEPGCQRQSPPHTKLVAFYPQDGMLFSNHPYIELNGMSTAKKAVADDFLAYLHTAAVQSQFAAVGFRTYDDRPTALVTQANGAVPNAPISPLPLPQPAVLDHLLTVWATLRKPANVLLLIDTSGSMNETVAGTTKTKLQLVQAAEPALLGGFTDTDQVGLWNFSAANALGSTLDYQPLVPIGPMGQQLATRTHRTVLADQINALKATGATGLYNTLSAAVATLRASYNPDSINAVVLLTDGRNETSGGLTLAQLLSQLQDPGKPLIRVFTIAYGSEADQADAGGKTVLQEISAATSGHSYDAKDPTTITNVLTNVISNF